MNPAYGTRIHRVTRAADGEGGRVRHEYSRRQAFNADNSRFLAQDGTGHWRLYDATSFAYLGRLDALAGDCEPLRDPRDADSLYYSRTNGGMVWWKLNTATGVSTVALNLRGCLPWPQATPTWTEGEGTLSADGRFLSLMATHYDAAAQKSHAFGLVTVDLKNGSILGTLDAANFPAPHHAPDHVSTSPSGRFVVSSWLDGLGGTWAYSVDFSDARQLTEGSEHSDAACDAQGHDVLVYADYAHGSIVSVNLDTRVRTELHPLYPVPGDAYTLHISEQAVDRPGWVVISTYANSSDYGALAPARSLQPKYRKVWLLEIAPKGRAFNVAHTRISSGSWQGDPYFLEPQASASRDLSRIIFASNLGGEFVESYIVDVPAFGD